MKTLVVMTIMQAFGGGWVLSPPLADAQTAVAAPSAALKQCIASQAPAVEQTFTSLNEGVDFLIGKVCAAPMAEQAIEAAREQSLAQKRKMDEMCKTAADKAPRDNYTDGIRSDPMLLQMCNNPMADLFSAYDDPSFFSYMGAPGISPSTPAATSLAAQTLLELRIDRLNNKR